MEQAFSTSKVTVEFFDPHGVYKLIAPGLIPRLPLHDLHWQSPSRPLRSIQTLHVDLVPSGSDGSNVLSPLASPGPRAAGLHRSESVASRDDGFQTASIGGRVASTEHVDTTARSAAGTGKERRHQIPGLRRTPYLKVLLVRCDDNDTYKSQTRAEIREWIKTQTPASAASTKKSSTGTDNHDAFEWLIIHVVIPNTIAATQPRAAGTKANSDSNPDLPSKSSSTSRWRGGSSSILDKIRSDLNSSTKTTVDRVAQIRIGINDVPYDMLPRVVPAVPTGYSETELDSENAWADLITKFKALILSSFDQRVSQYEEDIKEKDAQRSLPGWNFCTFFILKEGLARGFESVGLVEDALVGYDELSVGLDTIIQEQAVAGSAAAHGGVLLAYTEELRQLAHRALSQITSGTMDFEDEEAVDLQSSENSVVDLFKDIPISSIKKPYRDLILENKVSVFDFRCYIFARQVSLLLRLGNAWSTREELLAKLKEQHDSVMHLHGVAPRMPPPKPTDETENLGMLAEICRRTLEFIPAISQIIRRDIVAAMGPRESMEGEADPTHPHLDPALAESVDNITASFAFSVAQQILAQTSTRALPIPPSILGPVDGHEPKAAIPEPKTMMHPARSTSLNVRPSARAPPSPNILPGSGRGGGIPDADLGANQFLKAGLEELAARRAELYALSRNILEESGKRRGWSDGWASVPVVGDTDVVDMIDVDLAGDANGARELINSPPGLISTSLAGIENDLLRTALENRDDFYRLYEILTDKALRHYTVANYTHSVNTNFADLAVLKFYLREYSAAASFYYRATPFYGESGWSLLELSMLVMYSKCLKELNKTDDYVTVLRKLLSKAAAAEMERLREQPSPRPTPRKGYPQQSSLVGYLGELLSAAKTLQKGIEIPLASFFCDVAVDDAPVYDDGQDSFCLTLKIWSLLAEELEIQRCRLRIVSPAVGGLKEIWLQNSDPIVIRPGKNRLKLRSFTTIPGQYEAVHLELSANNILMYHERAIGQPADRSLTILRNPKVALYQRPGSLDVQLTASKNVQLDKNNSLELELLTGWNDVTECEIRIKAATGGLRLLMAEAKVVGAVRSSKPPEGGLFSFSSVPAQSSLKIKFPFTIETDLNSVAVKVEVAYTTDRGSFTFLKTPSVTISLALGVNVQDVFKHESLFSKFAVSTASPSPLRLFKSDLRGSDLFESQFGVPSSSPVMVFPKQPASLLYKVTRKKGSMITPKSKKTMYLKLEYSLVLDEIEDAFGKSLEQSLEGSPLRGYSKLLISGMLAQVREGLADEELERCALLGEVRTSFLSAINWVNYFNGFGKLSAQDVAPALSSFILAWQQDHTVLRLAPPDPASAETRSILIPVDIPSITVVHTADIRLDNAGATDSILNPSTGVSAVCINQLVPATLHLKWTRIWDTGNPDVPSAAPSSSVTPTVAGPSPAFSEDLEFSYEVTAPSDTWLVGGRKKGHFVIPGASASPADTEIGQLASSPDTEADIALLLVPLREGWLPYPSVEIREVKGAKNLVASTAPAAEPEMQSPVYGHCETDYRNLGDTVRVITDRGKITLSLDASGPGGGPLVLESASIGLGGRVVA